MGVIGGCYEAGMGVVVVGPLRRRRKKVAPGGGGGRVTEVAWPPKTGVSSGSAGCVGCAEEDAEEDAEEEGSSREMRSS